ncbi:hypothetical protein [Nocardia australiensis]|uniref:hypothetical protein n=1 Tax=Nocardia australiensis TaxID=2887191 RepID=UPI001D13E4DB|nr:hypothetical protein [Nocardia australiensis]
MSDIRKLAEGDDPFGALPYDQMFGALTTVAAMAHHQILNGNGFPLAFDEFYGGLETLRRRVIAIQLAVEWSDYRKEYSVSQHALAEAHKAFIAGWDAALGNHRHHRKAQRMTAQEDLSDLLFDQLDRSAEPYEIAGKVMAKGWRPPAQVISTGDELDTVPVGSIVAVGEGVATTRFSDGWYVTGEFWHLRSNSHELIESCGPVTVLWSPTEQTGDDNE